MNGNHVTVTDEEWGCRVKEIGTAEVQEFFEWLQGEADIERMCFRESPELSKEAAFSVIYYLQERLGVLEDSYELCCECNSIYDSYEEGVTINKDSTVVVNGKEIDPDYPEKIYGHYCDNCRPD